MHKVELYQIMDVQKRLANFICSNIYSGSRCRLSELPSRNLPSRAPWQKPHKNIVILHHVIESRE
jgi:hypothetical protein